MLIFQCAGCASDLVSAPYYWCLSFAVLMACLISWLHGENSSAWIFAFFSWWYFVKCCSMIFWHSFDFDDILSISFPWYYCVYRKSSVSFSPTSFLPKLITRFCFTVELSSFFSYLLLLSNVLSKLLRFLPVDLRPLYTLH